MRRSESIARHLLFLACVVGGIAALGASIVPRPEPKRPLYLRQGTEGLAAIDPTVAAVNEAFRAEWQRAGVEPASPAEPLAVARRLSLGLTGTIPSLEEIRDLERYLRASAPREEGSAAAQPPQRAEQWWLDRLLESKTDRRYGDYMAERLARSMVGTHLDPFILYRRRRFVMWISEELRKNRPYDELVRQIVSETGVWNDRPAANFITSTIHPDNGRQTPDCEELAGATARAFLGVRLDCAQCHDHPFQPEWKQTTFQGLAAFYGQARNSFTGIRDVTTEHYRPLDPEGKPGEPFTPGVPFLAELLPPAGEAPERQRLAVWLTHPDNPYFSRAIVNRVWAMLFGRALVEPVDDIVAVDDLPPALDILAADFAKHDFDLRRLIRVIASTEVFQLDSAADSEVTEVHEATWAVFPLTRLRPEQVVGGLLQATHLSTIDEQSHIILQLARFDSESKFVERYGDAGQEELREQAGTIPQRLLMMNGNLVQEQIKPELLTAPQQIAMLAEDDPAAIRTAYLTVLSREPTPQELSHFCDRLANARGEERQRRLSDLYWTLINATEFSWNH